MSKYEKLSAELTERMMQDIRDNTRPDFAAKGNLAVRRDPSIDQESIWRHAYSRDVDKIIHSPYYNRYTDKTQVFSFYKNDDITRRALHVQLVSRIARTIGSALNLNLDLIEAIALGHDIGHTPFGHAGEKYISEIYREECGRYFNHNVHSVRVLDTIFNHNLTLDTLNGIITHNGEFEMNEYRPEPMSSFDLFDDMVESCYVDQSNIIKILEIAVIVEVYRLVGEHIVIKLGAVIICHRRHIVDNDLIGLGLEIRQSGLIVVVKNKVNMMLEYRRGLIPFLDIGQELLIHSVHERSDLFVKNLRYVLGIVYQRIVISLSLSHLLIML